MNTPNSTPPDDVHLIVAKDEEVIVIITGEGPATNTPVEMAQ